MVGTFTVSANIPAPTATGLSPDKVCQTPTASIITITPSGTCASGNVRLYMNQTTVGGGVSSTTANAGGLIGAYDFYLGCVNGSCETLPAERVKVTFRINTTPATPTLTPASTTNVCFGTPVTLTAAGCAATDTLKIWSSNAAGTSLIALQQSAVGTTTTVDVTPAAGVTTYYVARCVNTNCSSPSSTSASVQVRAAVTAPTSGTLLPSSACASDPSVTMTTNTTCGSLATIWYTQATGGTPIASLPTTTPTTVGVTTYYAACRDLVTNCESTTRYALTFTLNPAGSAPVGASLTPSGTVCGTGNVPITLASACPAGETMLVSVDGAPYSAVIPTTQMADGSNHIYRVRCQAGTGATACVGPESSLMVLRINAAPAAPVASLFINGQAPTPICTGGSPLVLTSNTNCGSNQTVWFDASNNTQLASLPTTTSTTPGTYSYFARCLGVGGCTSANSNTVSYSVLPVLAQPTVTSNSTGVVCAGTSVTFSQNCAAGSTPQWSTGATTATISLTLQSGGSQVVSVKCIQSGYCDSPVSAQVSASWSSTFDVTLINVGSSQAAIKGISGTPKSAWASQFITVDAGPSLAASSQGNPAIYYTENINKSAPRYWTAHVETCNLGTEGSVGFDMLCTPEIGLPLSFNTIENYAPYLMYANRDGFTELYAQNNPFFGFYAADPIAPGKNTYDSGFPKGLYKLSVRYWSQKGLGIAPAVRTAQGKELAYAEYYFRIQSRNGIGAGAAREGVSENTEAPFVTMGQNPVTRTLSLTINGAKGQEVKLNLVDASGRSIKASSVTPETNTHREEIDMTSQNTGMYFIQVSTPSKRASLKVLKVSQD